MVRESACTHLQTCIFYQSPFYQSPVCFKIGFYQTLIYQSPVQVKFYQIPFFQIPPTSRFYHIPIYQSLFYLSPNLLECVRSESFLPNSGTSKATGSKKCFRGLRGQLCQKNCTVTQPKTNNIV
jgi:hypothetical protein